MINTTVLSEINTKINETQRPTTSPISNTFPVFDTIPGFVFGPIRLLCHPWSWGNNASPQWQNGTYTTVVSPSPPNTRFLQRWRKKNANWGTKKLRGDLNFEEIVYMFFHKTIVWRLKKKFSSRAVWISTTFGATVFDLLKFNNKDHFDLAICKCLAVKCLAVTSSVMMTTRTASTHYYF